VEATSGGPPRLFANDRPVVLYNPHFDRTLSSWPACGLDVLKAFAEQDAYNLIFAPHVRLFGAADPQDLRMLAPFRDHPAIHIDLGARASLDMTYTRMADIYLGDVSSQVYEFLQQPKPCLFLNAHNADWRGQESYRHWRFGPVLDKVQGLIAEVDAARLCQAAYADEQVASFNYTFAPTPRGPSFAAAEAIAKLIGLSAIPEPAAEPVELRAFG
jgi:CDP-glycerol glycerophosphotransferase (TagB/SpsB family)